LGHSRIQAANILRQYLCDEAGVCKGKRGNAITLNASNPVFKTIPNPTTPLQPNFDDCGMYMLEAMEKILQNYDKYHEYLLVSAEVIGLSF